MRVLLTNLPPLLRDILTETLAGESDMSVVGGGVRGDAESLIGQLSPDVVLIQASRDEAERLFRAFGSVVVAIDPRADRALVFRDSEPVMLRDVSPTSIVMAIRGTA